MEKTFETKPLDETVFKLLLIPLTANLYKIICALGLELREGIILHFPDKKVRETLVKFYTSLNGEEGDLHGSRIPIGQRHMAIYVPYQSFHKAEGIYRFFSCKEYLPVMTVAGIYPTNLIPYQNVLSFDNLQFNEEILQTVKKEYHACLEYIFAHTAELRRYVENALLICNTYLTDSDSSVVPVLFVVATAYHYYLTQSGAFEFTLETAHRLLKEICVEDMDCEFEILAPLKSQLHSYIDHHSCPITRVDSIDDKLFDAVRAKQIILCDNTYYYIPEQLLRDATSQLHEEVSFTRIKNMLYTKGILICDETTSNYTVKKQVISTSGDSTRGRFLRLSREHLDDASSFSLEERRTL